jgi:hypothetical protein
MKQEKQEQEHKCKQKSNKILLPKKKPNKVITRKRTQIDFEESKGNG